MAVAFGKEPGEASHDLTREGQGREEWSAADDVIGVSALVKNYHNDPAVQGVSFRVRRGEIFALLGPNGAGKTTIVEILEFLKTPTRGFFYVLDSEAVYHATKSYSGVKEKIGVLPQSFSGFDRLTVYENVDYFSRMYAKPADVDALIDELGLREKRNTLFTHLSGGLKQRVGIAIALVNDPEVVFLDEPSAGLDPKARRDLWDVIKGLKARGKTVFLTTHFMDEAYYLADRVCILHKGRIVAMGTPEDLINTHGGGNTLVVRGCSPAAQKRLAEAIPGSHAVGSDLVAALAKDNGLGSISRAVGIIAGAGLSCKELYVKKPTLDDVFLNLTGEKLAEKGSTEARS